ncbi:single-stranded-DNA-specific exonuclease RecJ [Candidatus Microgenomates bacterium]|nr:single-stranded-DNA-specific exonuclease RecJ [Candidatus Microgenomates bacterium]
MNNTIWKITDKISAKAQKALADYDEVTRQLLFSRGIITKKEAEDFFHPNYEDLPDPYSMKDMEKAVKRIIRAIEKKERIVIYGDYDVDGITSTALLYQGLLRLGADVKFYIPHRVKEGYGMNVASIDFLAEEGTRLIITVDNGISAHEEIEQAKKLGMDIVITDHHEITKDVPEAYAILNPKQKNDAYPFKDLCGVGVAFKLISALVIKTKKKDFSPDQLKWYLDLVALGTISDVMPLVGENRALVHFGLIVLTQTKNIGLKALAKIGGIDLKKSSPYTIGFQIGPRLNAAGRMAHAETALSLILADDIPTAEMLALRLERLNSERQKTVKESLENLKASFVEKKMTKALVVGHKDWSAGIIGLIAGRMSEEFSRPVFCLSLDGDVFKGSVRSSINFSVIEALSATKECYIGYGGHFAAGGFSILPENFDIFQSKIISYAENILQDEDMAKILMIDMEIDGGEIGEELFTKIQKFAPFGQGNREPVFASQFKIKEAKAVGEDGKHLKLALSSDSKNIYGIAFGLGDLASRLPFGTDVKIAYNISENIWGERRRIEMKVKDIKIG